MSMEGVIPATSPAAFPPLGRINQRVASLIGGRLLSSASVSHSRPIWSAHSRCCSGVNAFTVALRDKRGAGPTHVLYIVDQSFREETTKRHDPRSVQLSTGS